MVKALITVEGVAYIIKPGLNITDAAQKPVRSILLNQFNPVEILRGLILVLPEMIDIISFSPLIVSEGLKSLDANLKKPPLEINIIRNSLLAGFCLITAAILLSFGTPWPLWTALFLIAIILALRS